VEQGRAIFCQNPSLLHKLIERCLIALKIILAIRVAPNSLDTDFSFHHNDQYGQSEPMIREVNAVNFRQNLGEMLNHVQYGKDAIVINKDGKPVAALVDAALFSRIRRMADRFDTLTDRIAEAYATVPLEEGSAEIDSAVNRERAR
jgi:prevent-host-death family protein